MDTLIYICLQVKAIKSDIKTNQKINSLINEYILLLIKGQLIKT